ncbi:MAG: glycosyltransferase [Chloroflexota bacterium]|nr:glycosyltransferase [Chloroflexota bacterium]
MKLLFLTPQLPYPPQQGTTIRNFNIIRNLAPRHDITLLSFGTPEELQNAEPLCALCRQIVIAPYPTRTMMQRAVSTLFSPLPDMALRLKSDEMHAQVAAILRDNAFDVVQVEGIEMARYVPIPKSDSRTSPKQRSRSNSRRRITLTFFRMLMLLRAGTLEPVYVENDDRARYAPISPPATRHSSLVFDDHNAEYVLQRTAFESDARRVTRWLAALYSLIQWKKLERYERAICQHADRIVACSDADANAISALLKTQSAIRNLHSAITVVPNGVDIDHFIPSTEVCAKPLAELSMVFAGKMDFRPNIDAMLWFCDEILPRIRAEIPLAHIVIVGQKPAPRIAALGARQGIEATGWVSDTRPYIADAAVYVVPLRMGSGTRLKVLEALAMGKAIVSTARGVEGIDLAAGHDAVIADTPDAFAREAVALLRDAERRRALGQAARALAESKYDWREIVPKFEQVYANLAKVLEPSQG